MTKYVILWNAKLHFWVSWPVWRQTPAVSHMECIMPSLLWVHTSCPGLCSLNRQMKTINPLPPLSPPEQSSSAEVSKLCTAPAWHHPPSPHPPPPPSKATRVKTHDIFFLWMKFQLLLQFHSDGLFETALILECLREAEKKHEGNINRSSKIRWKLLSMRKTLQLSVKL